MLQRDYFIRIIEEFMAALSRFLEKKVDERRLSKMVLTATKVIIVAAAVLLGVVIGGGLV